MYIQKDLRRKMKHFNSQQKNRDLKNLIKRGFHLLSGEKHQKIKQKKKDLHCLN